MDSVILPEIRYSKSDNRPERVGTNKRGQPGLGASR